MKTLKENAIVEDEDEDEVAIVKEKNKWKVAFDGHEMVKVNHEDQLMLVADIFGNDKIVICSNSWKGEKVIPLSVLFDLIQYRGYTIVKNN